MSLRPQLLCFLSIVLLEPGDTARAFFRSIMLNDAVKFLGSGSEGSHRSLGLLQLLLSGHNMQIFGRVIVLNRVSVITTPS